MAIPVRGAPRYQKKRFSGSKFNHMEGDAFVLVGEPLVICMRVPISIYLYIYT